ncbi:hypothetical protein Sa4125_30140 [Aureimonas sp. SA4125]|uniref:hypothetical protein n=1 Tax=Aureimonas sp. SA4125 TaxID=2826993 RepID=UPI001CC81CF9|nr:hypothetical protein [Aureimonas sp. SA4125]BDA85472.1 hypothetical protein Sa4125_30140 [Aureimonas sp. SA4125]
MMTETETITAPLPTVDLIDDYLWEAVITDHGRPKWALQRWEEAPKSWATVGSVAFDEFGKWWSWKPEHVIQRVLPTDTPFVFGKSDCFGSIVDAAEHLAVLCDAKAGTWHDQRRRTAACVSKADKAMPRSSIPRLYVQHSDDQQVALETGEAYDPRGRWEDWLAFAKAIIAAERETARLEGSVRPEIDWWQRFCAIQRNSFIPIEDVVRRVDDRCGRWIDQHEAAEIVDGMLDEIQKLRAARDGAPG